MITIRSLCLSLGVILFSLPACDDGRIYPEEAGEEETGGRILLNTAFSNLDVWPQQYMLLLAAYDEDSSIPLKSKVISKPGDENEQVNVFLNNLNEKCKFVSVVVTNKGRQMLYKYCTFAIDDPEADLVLPVDEIDLATYDRISQQVFDGYCITCHGEGDQAAAGLNLTQKEAYKSLINVPAITSSAKRSLVIPGNASDSYLVEILENDIVRYNHTDVLPEAELITLIESWISNGATDN